MIKNNKGSLTVEAAIVLPIFIFTIFTLGFFIKVLYVNETMHQGVVEVANEISRLGYLYSKTGLLDVQEEIEEELDSNIIQSKNENKYQSIINIIKKIIEDQEVETEDLVINIADSITNDLKIQKNIYTKEGIDFIFKVICNTIAKKIFKEYVAESQLDYMQIIDGYKGLNFDYSRYFYMEEGINNQIDLILTYQIKVFDPFNLIGNVSMCQAANVRVWSGSSKFYYGNNSSISNTDENTIVYIIGNGTHYHLANCSRINIDKTLVTRQEAINRGYVPCEHCKPQDEDEVFITKYGECYHTKNCPHINPKVKEITLKEALEKNYEPCRICKPPY